MRPTAKTATPEVAEPISSKQLATTAGRWMPARTTAIPRIGAHRSGDLTPAFSPVTMALGFEVSVATCWSFVAASISSRMTARGTVRLIARATSPTAPPLVGPKSGPRTARKDWRSRGREHKRIDDGGRPTERLHKPQEQPRDHEKPGMRKNQCQNKMALLQQKI